MNMTKHLMPAFSYKHAGKKHFCRHTNKHTRDELLVLTESVCVSAAAPYESQLRESEVSA